MDEKSNVPFDTSGLRSLGNSSLWWGERQDVAFAGHLVGYFKVSYALNANCIRRQADIRCVGEDTKKRDTPQAR